MGAARKPHGQSQRDDRRQPEHDRQSDPGGTGARARRGEGTERPAAPPLDVRRARERRQDEQPPADTRVREGARARARRRTARPDAERRDRQADGHASGGSGVALAGAQCVCEADGCAGRRGDTAQGHRAEAKQKAPKTLRALGETEPRRHGDAHQRDRDERREVSRSAALRAREQPLRDGNPGEADAGDLQAGAQDVDEGAPRETSRRLGRGLRWCSG